MKTVRIRAGRAARSLRHAALFLGAAGVFYLLSLRGGAVSPQAVGAPGNEVTTQEYTVPAQEVHLLSFGGYDEEVDARVEAARYVSRGTAGYIYPAERLFVIAAAYESRQDAERVAGQIEAQEGIACQVISVRSEPVSLRITATPGQIETLVSADATMREALDELFELSFALDDPQVDYLEVTGRMQDAVDRTCLAANALRGEYALTRLGVGQGYLSLLDGYAESLRRLLTDGAETTLAFSSRLKYALISSRLSYIAFLMQATG